MGRDVGDCRQRELNWGSEAEHAVHEAPELAGLLLAIHNPSNQSRKADHDFLLHNRGKPSFPVRISLMPGIHAEQEMANMMKGKATREHKMSPKSEN